MILDNTYCKGKWEDNPVATYTVDQETKRITYTLENQLETEVYESCEIEDRKNWTCLIESSDETITVKDGKLQLPEKSDLRQITRLEWLQSKLLEKVS